MSREAIHRETFTVPADAVDGNQHVNNVVWVQWMQDVAIRHSDAVGGTAAMTAAGGSWVARSHQVVYLKPARLGDRIEVLTWVTGFRRVRSLRRYRFLDADSGALLVTGETDWVFVDRETGRPKSVPPEVARCFPLVPAEEEPA